MKTLQLTTFHFPKTTVKDMNIEQKGMKTLWKFIKNRISVDTVENKPQKPGFFSSNG